MQKKVKIIKSFRKTLSLQVKNGEVILKSPFFISQKTLDSFLTKHKLWIEERLNKLAKITLSKPDKDILKNLAKKIITKRVESIASKNNFSYNLIKITSAETRWGSCTSKKNLNFSYRLIGTPDFVIDYVICHELSHLKHMNHSKSFWNQVAEIYPEYKTAEKWLKDNGNNLNFDKYLGK